MLYEETFDEIQTNIILASILGDGEITKAYPNSRRKNVSYREHFCLEQYDYRKWKASFFPDFLYFRKDKQTLVSASVPLMTELFSYYYDNDGNKHIPLQLLKNCVSNFFVATLYMDDGSLLISKRINHRMKKIYLSSVIALYLQCYTKVELEQLAKHFKIHFNLNLRLQKRNDGYGYILKTSKMNDTMAFLNTVLSVSENCPSMYYKTNWKYRFAMEKKILKNQFPSYEVLATSSDRFKEYSKIEIRKIIELKQKGKTDQAIADKLNRSYWSIVYKLTDLRRNGQL